MNRFSKWWQRWMLDYLTKEQPPLFLLFLTVFGSVFGIGFLCAHWIDQVDFANYKLYSNFADNIGSIRLDLMTDILPIDVVYTWVNGSDPELLQNLKEINENSDRFKCLYQNCFASSYISIFTDHEEAENLKIGFPINILKSVEVSKGSEARIIKLAQLDGDNNFNVIKEQLISYLGPNTTVQRAYWTSEIKVGWSVEWKSAAFLRLFKDSDYHAEISNIIPNDYIQFFELCSMAKYKDTYIIECSKESLIENLKAAIEDLNNNNKYPKYWPAHIILQSDKPKLDLKADFEVNRFIDNEELRYSLRSLEKYAPWVRRIFLVTNGQIPYWLDLDHPRLTIVTHDQIFSNLSHLPTYSSPAIESQIHRIPGLSTNFLYLNDDVMFGETVWPEDFYSPASGYKIYLAWSLPECSSGCPGTWINDGYCDRACNTSECNWDGGDCPGDKESVPSSDYFDKGDTDIITDFEYCSTSCADTWLGDSYCDTACSTETCGFDAGDCGEEIVKENVFQILFDFNRHNTIILPKGTLSAWADFKEFTSQHQNVSSHGSYTDTKGIRACVFNSAIGLFIFILKSNYSETFDMDLTLTTTTNEETKTIFKITMTIEFDTHPTSKELLQNELKKINSSFKIPHFNFSDPGPQIFKFDASKYEQKEFNISNFKLPKNFNQSLEMLAKDLSEGYLTNDGYSVKKKILLNSMFEKEGRNLEKNESYQSNKYVDLSSVNFHRTLLYFDKKKEELNKLENSLVSFNGNFPWERHKYYKFFKIQNTTDNISLSDTFDNSLLGNDIMGDKFSYIKKNNLRSKVGRRLLDAFSDSLLFVNRLYNSEYEFEARRVLAHMPHFINKKILEELHDKFADEFYVTSSHKLRQGNDMQFAFSYFYYVMSEKIYKSYDDIFRDFDTDLSGTWSDREIRTFLAKTNDLPLTYSMINDLHKELKNCSEMYKTMPVPTKPYERYADSNLPIVSQELVVKCASSILSSRLHRLIKVPRFRYSVMPDSSVHFKMISSNLSTVVHQLDDVRKHSKKFVCLNSDLDPQGKDNDLIRALMQDTYESLYPLASSFELPYNYRNRFSYMWEVEDWRRWRNLFRALIYASISCLAILTILTFFKTEIETVRRRWCRRLIRKERTLGLRV